MNGKISEKTFKEVPEKRKINPSVLRAYDIRGEVGEKLHIEDAYYIGKAFATLIIEKSQKLNPVIAVGYDGRLTSEDIQQQLCKGIISTGADVQRVGLGPSPMLYYAVRSGDLDGGVMVTGSHNPPKHNGFKMMFNKHPLFGDEIQTLGKICEKGEFVNSQEQGVINDIDLKEKYIDRMLENFAPLSNKDGDAQAAEFFSQMKIAWDPGNGASGRLTELLCQRFPNKNILLNSEIDGNFPNHHPDPTVAENLEQLIETVKRENCALGIAFDGDGDRIGAVDGNGTIIWGDQMMTIYAKDVLKNNEGATIIADVKASKVFFEEVEKMGGKPLMWKTGHSFIKNKLAETGAPLAGEMSGHIFFADEYYGFDDAIYAAIRLINYFCKNQVIPKNEVAKFPNTYASQEYRIAVKEEDKFRIVDEVKKKVLDSDTKVNQIDGIRVDEKQGWWLLRASNTQSVITIRAEATSQNGLQSLKNKLNEFLAPYGLKEQII